MFAQSIAAALALLIPATALAQLPPPRTVDEVRKDARMHIGALYVTPEVQLKELGVDTNVFNQASDQQSDFMFNVNPKANAWVPFGRRALLTTSAGTDLVWFSKFTSQRSIDPALGARTELFLNRLTLFGQYDYLNSHERSNQEIDLRTRHIDRSALAGGAYRLTPKTSVEFTGRLSTLRYADDGAPLGTRLYETLNRDTTALGGGVIVRVTPLTTFVVRAASETDDYEFSTDRNAKSFRIMPGVEFKPRALISGSASVGFRRFAAQDNVSLPEYTGVVALTALSYTLRGSTTFGATVSRDVHPSFERLQPYYVSTDAGASVRRALGPRFDALVSVDRYLYDYRNFTGAAATEGTNARTDTTWIYRGSLGYRPSRDTRIAFGVSYAQRNSTTLDFREYDRLRVGVVITTNGS